MKTKGKGGKPVPKRRAPQRRAAATPVRAPKAPPSPVAPPAAPEPARLTAKQVQDQLGISERTFQRMAQDGLRPAVVGVGSKPALYDPITVAVYMRQSVDDAGSSENDGWMEGAPGSSVHLEAYRKEKAREARRKNDQAEGRIITVEDLHVMMDAIFDPLGAELGALQRAHMILGNALLDALGRAKAKALEILPQKPEAKVEPQGQLL